MLALSQARRSDRPRSPDQPGTLLLLLLLIASLAAPPRGFPAQPASRPATEAPTPRGFPPRLDLAPTPPARPYALPGRLAGRPELVGRRTLTSATYELGPGRYGMVVDQRPLHYEAAPGRWEPIQAVFETRETGWVNAANTLQTGVAANRSAAKVWAGQLGLGWEPRSLAATDASGRSASLATPLGDERARPGQRSADGGAVRYAASWSDLAVQDQWQVGRGESAYSLRLAERPRARGIAPASLDLEIALNLLPGTTLQVDGRPASLPLETHGALSFVDGSGQAIELAPPLAFEQADPLSRAAGSYVVSAGDGGTLRLIARLPWAWFAAAGRQYPVIIDPVFQMRNGTVMRSPAYWPNYDTHRGDYGYGIGRYRDGDSGQQLQLAYLVKFALPTLPRETTDFFPVQPTISAATLVATPVDGGIAGSNWASMQVQARALNSDQWTDFGAAPLSAGLQGANLSPEWQPIGYSAGDPENPTSATWDVTGLVDGWFSNPAVNDGIALFASNPFCARPSSNGCAGISLADDRNWIDADLARAQNSSNPHQAFSSPNKTGGVRLVVEYAAPTLKLGAPVQDIASPTNGEPYYRSEHTYRLDPAIANPWVAVATRSLKPTVNLPPPSPPDGHTRTRTDTDLPVPFEVKSDVQSFNTVARAIDGHNVRFIGLRNDFIQNNGTLIVSPSNALPAAYQLDVVPQRGAVAGTVQNVGDTASFTTFTVADSDMFNFWDLSLPSEPNVNTRVDLSITPRYESDSGNGGTTPPITVPDAELLPRFRASFNEVSLVGQTFRGGGRADNPSPDNSLHSFELGPADANTTYKLGLSYDGPQVVSWMCEQWSGEFCDNYTTAYLRFSIGIRITSCRPTAGGDATYPTSQGKCQVVACPTEATPPAYFRGAGNFGVWGAGSLAGETWTTTDGDIAPLLGVNNFATVPTVAAVGGRIRIDGGGSVTVDATAGTPSLKLINCGSKSAPNTLGAANTYTVFNRPASSVGAGLRAVELAVTPWFEVWNSAADIVPASRSSEINVAAGRFVNAAQFSLAAGNADESAALGAAGSWSVNYQGWTGLETSLGELDGASASVASMTLTGGPAYGFDVQPSGGKDSVRQLTAIRFSQATITHKAELGGASKPVKALLFPRNTPVPGATANVCKTAAGATLNCLDLRAPSDTPSAPNRIWAMPDVHLELSANSLLLQKPGEVRAFSTDHPMAAPNDISQNFSYDTFGASVSVTQEKCGGDAIVTVIRGETRLTLPNVGDGTSPDGVIAASFKLCGGALRQVHMEFKSPLGIPIGSTGFFLTGLSGTVDIMPDYTQIKFGLDFQAAQGGDGGLLKAHGEVTIDTRGLIGFSGKARILSAIDAEGKVWVAWNPLDMGFETKLSYAGWLTATSRGHLWKGQGWQNRYSWLPDNDETHLAAELAATITIHEGDILETFIIDIPPDDIDFTLSL
ncbi:MAG TPA: hypothetical protein VD886_08885, partial [Herpetosiphonaceae bacterium]|nr:hypothetical protein [Herpetosiphonaceae bacterium]